MTGGALRLVRTAGAKGGGRHAEVAKPLVEQPKKDRPGVLRNLLEWAGTRPVARHIMPDREEVVYVVRLLHDRDPQIRLNAIFALRNAIAKDRNGTVALLHLQYMIMNPAEATITRYEAAKALGTALQIESTREATEHILRGSLSASDPDARMLAQITLARFR